MKKFGIAAIIAYLTTVASATEIASTTYVQEVADTKQNTLPAGETGQVLTKTADGVAWNDLPEYDTGSSETAGLTKLYDETGENIDGSMTQAAITIALNAKITNNATGTDAMAIGSGATGVGNYTTSVGYQNAAAGASSVSMGYKNTATGNYSTAVGYSNETKAEGGIAMGRGNVNEGAYAVTVGYKNTNTGEASGVAVGRENTTSGGASSAVGYSNTASGVNSSAMGYSNTASGVNSSAFGFQNIASGADSSALGRSNTASGVDSSALGRGNAASGESSVAVGRGNNPKGQYSSAMGYKGSTGASAQYSTQIGPGATDTANTFGVGLGETDSSGNFISYPLLTTGGKIPTERFPDGVMINTGTGTDSVAAGVGNTASGNYSSAIGTDNTAEQQDSAAIGFWNEATGQMSYAIGGYNTASGYESSALGYYNTASGSGSSAVGYYNVANGDYSSVFGYYGGTGDDAEYAIQIGPGLNETAHTFSIGLGETDGNSYYVAYPMLTAGGKIPMGRLPDGLVISTARGTDAISIGADSSATGATTLSLGYKNTAPAESGTAVGYNNTTNGTNSTALGYKNSANGNNSTAVGYNSFANVADATAVGHNSVANGTDSTAVGYKNVALGADSSALGNRANTGSNAKFSTQIGPGTVNTANTLSVGVGDGLNSDGSGTAVAYPLVVSGGTIPAGRLTGQTNGTDNNGTSGQVLTSDGDGTMSWTTIEIPELPENIVTNNATGTSAMAIGVDSTATAAQGTTVGYKNTGAAKYGTVVGYQNVTNSTADGVVAVGYKNNGNKPYTVAVGYKNTTDGNYSSAIGYSGATGASAQYSTQIGPGTTTTANTFGIGLGEKDSSGNFISYPMLTAGGKIPVERMPTLSLLLPSMPSECTGKRCALVHDDSVSPAVFKWEVVRSETDE